MNKLVVWCFAVIALIALLFYGFFSGPIFPDFNDIKNNPSMYYGIHVEYFGIAQNISSQGFVLSTGEQDILVHAANIQKTNFGYTSVDGVLLSDVSLQAIEVWYHNNGWYIFIPSILGGLFVLFLFFRDWRFRKWRFVKCRTG